jgi:hypothetical protein
LYANPQNPLSAGFNDIGGYVLASVSNMAYKDTKTVSGVLDRARYTVLSGLDLIAAFYGYQQNAYGMCGCPSIP